MNFIEYVKQIWKNGPSGSTPWSAARLNHIEDGIKNNNSMISELNSNITTTCENAIITYAPGAIRKCAMVISIMLLVIVDYITGFNMIGFLPEEIRQHIGNSIGISGFIALLYIAYETVSILKNMALCGLPVKKLWLYVKTFLSKYTDELPDDDELAEDKAVPEVSNNKTYIN